MGVQAIVVEVVEDKKSGMTDGRAWTLSRVKGKTPAGKTIWASTFSGAKWRALIGKQVTARIIKDNRGYLNLGDPDEDPQVSGGPAPAGIMESLALHTKVDAILAQLGAEPDPAADEE